jgi:hypothetical protein
MPEVRHQLGAILQVTREFFEGAVEGFRQGKGGPSSAQLRKIELLERDNGLMK